MIVQWRSKSRAQATAPPDADQSGTPGTAHYLLLGAVFALAAALRLVNIGEQALWGDEGLTLIIAHWPVPTMFMEPTDPTPALYYALHKALFSADMSAGMLRSLSFACGLLSIGVIYLLGRLAFSAAAGLLAAALLAAWPQHVDYSQEARTYALLFLLTAASATSLLWWHRLAAASLARRLTALALFVLTTALSFYTHLVSIFWIFLALQILLLGGLSAQPRRVGEVAAACALMAAMAVPGIIRLVRQLDVPTGFNWLRQASPTQFAETTLHMLIPLGNTLLVGCVALALGLFWFFRRRRTHRARREDTVVQCITLAFLSLPLLIWAFGFSVVPIFMSRTILFAVPGAILALLALVTAFSSPRLRIGIGAAAVLAILASTLAQGTTRPKEDWRGLMAALQGRVKTGDVVLMCLWQQPSLRVVADRPLPAPLLDAYSEAMPVMLEEQLGARADWDRLFFRYALVKNQSGSRRNIDMPPGSSVWLVESQCPPEARRNLAAWLKPSRQPRPVWSSPTTDEVIGIDLSRVQVQAPVSLPVRVPPELEWPQRRQP